MKFGRRRAPRPRGEDIDYEGALDEATANFAGEMIANTDVLNDFIRQHSGDRTLLEKLRDALHELVQKLTGKAKKQAQTAEGMLQEAFEAASRRAEAHSKNAANEGGEAKYSIKNIVGDSGKQYGIGVYLDSSLLENLTDSERVQMVRERIRELGGQTFVAYDSAGNEVNIQIAEHGARFKNKNGASVPVNRDIVTKNRKSAIKQKSVVLADELISAAKYKKAALRNIRMAGWTITGKTTGLNGTPLCRVKIIPYGMLRCILQHPRRAKSFCMTLTQ